MLIYKIFHAADWPEETRICVAFAGSARDREDGFLHFSLGEQLQATLDKHYARDDDLFLAAVESDALGAALKFEPSRGGEAFPHLYAPLSFSAVRWIRPLSRDTDCRSVISRRE
jgi:uncharacterized protein (DUF952 family)